MGLLVEDLLQLARLDQQRPLDMTPVDMLTLAADAVQDAGSWRRTGLSTSRSRRAPRSSWRVTSSGCGR